LQPGQFERRAHLEEHMPRKLIGLEVRFRAAAAVERVAGEMMTDLVGHDAGRGTVGSGAIDNLLHERLAVQDQPLAILDHGGRVRDVGRADREVLRQSV
jgi:hypothetical protein